jgi:hypothetical protein
MLKAEAEVHFRALAGQWLRAVWRPEHGDAAPSFMFFSSWLREHHPEIFNFRSRVDQHYLMDLWFDQETGQLWKR